MTDCNTVSGSTRFGPFEVSPQSGELRKYGTRVKLSGQAIQVLTILLEQPGRIVTRQELQEKLWPGASYGDFEQGLNAAVNRLRDVLGDSATEPKFVETVPRRGYRFIGRIEPESVPRESTTPVSLDGKKLSVRDWQLRHWTLLFIIAGLLLSLGTGVYVLLHHPRQSLEQLKIVPFTSYPGHEAASSFSPDGNQIAFAWYRQELSSTPIADLYVKQIGNENAVRLTHHGAKFLVPAWSPDGLNIAFAMVGKAGNGIYLLPSLGGRERQLAELRPTDWPWLLLSWSPDGKRLAFASYSSSAEGTAPAKYRIHLLNVETGEEGILPEPAPDCAMTIEPTISPDGKYLASVCVLSIGTNKLYIQRVDGSLPRELARIDTSYVLAGIAWAADGHSIIYSTFGTTGRLWRVSAEGGRPELLASAHGTAGPAVAYVGARLAYTQTNHHFDIWRIGLHTRGSAPPVAKFISSTWDQANPQISPDGKLIVFDSSRSGNYEIWVCDRDGSNAQQLTFFEGPQTGGPRWSPDGKQVVFNSKVSGQTGLYVLPANGGRPHQVITGTTNALSPFWSADQRWIYFASEHPSGVWKVPAGGGTAVRLTKDGTYPQESADGKRVFYMTGWNNGELWSASVDGGDERRVAGLPDLANNSSWTLFQDGIYFIAGTPGSHILKYFNFSEQKALTVAEVPGIAFVCCGVAVTRNDDTVLFSGLDRVESDIMMVENFR